MDTRPGEQWSFMAGTCALGLGELDAGIADAREGMVIWRGQGIVFLPPQSEYAAV